MKLFKVGDVVAFSSKWLKSTQAHELKRDKGTVVEVFSSGGLVLCKVQWPDRMTSVLNQNLVRWDARHLEGF